MEDRLRQLLAINRVIAESLDHEEILEVVVAKTSELLRARECVLLLTDDRGVARVAASRGVPAERAAAFAQPLDERINVALRDLLSYRDSDTFLGVPVVHAGQVRGILVVNRDDRELDGEDEAPILAALADQAAIALDHASRYRKLWQESAAAQRALEIEGKRKDEFLAMLSHELRNPLAAIANAHAVLRLARPGAEVGHVHDIAERQTAHMKRLLDDLLDVSRVTQDKIELDRRPLRLQDVARQALLATQPLFAEREHELTVRLPEEALVVDGDHDRLVQVLTNLLTNAAKFTPSGGHVALTAVREREQAVLRVRDDGVGMAPELLPSVFELFVQAERRAARSEGGLGIGLALVRRLMEMHGGTVTARSDGIGRGSELELRLPLSAASAAEVAVSEADDGAVESRCVLLVEDNADVADMLAEALRQLGHEVRVAPDGETALREVEREHCDVVLVDIGLPGIDGYEVARRLRARPRGRVPLLVALTGYGSTADRERARAAGFDHHLTKPVRMEQLARLLARGA